MKASIVVPFKEENEYIKECVDHCLRLKYSNYEIILLPDSKYDFDHPLVKTIPTGPVGPAEKRDLAMKVAEGEILAFIDDDAYPRVDWLENAVRYFSDEVVAVCGPAITPDSDSLSQKASGMVLASRVGGGGMTYRYEVGDLREVDDYPSCNFLIKREVMLKLGGFDTSYWPGEDTKLCLDITKKMGKKIVYAPDVVVYHHRRKLFRPHLKQIWRYGVNRGYFVKEFPETSRRVGYFLPSIFSLGLVFGGITYYINYYLFMLFVLVVSIYVALVASASARAALEGSDVRLIGLVFAGIVFTHLFYGMGFLKGLFAGGIER